MISDELNFNMKYPINTVIPKTKETKGKKEYITCKICLQKYAYKRNKWHHEQTLYHKKLAELNIKMRDLLLTK